MRPAGKDGCRVKMMRSRGNENCEGANQLRVKKQMKDSQSNIRVVAEEEDMRRWDKMPHDILVTIIKRLTCHYSPAFDLSYAYICRSWQLAVLDVLFPPDKTLDLRCLDSYPWNCSTKFFRRYLMLALNRRPASAWTTLYLPNKAIFVERYYRQVNTIILEDDILTLIAGKTPQLRNLYVPQAQALSRQLFLKLVPNWKNLSKVQIDISDYSFSALETNCRFIRELSLYGWMMNAHLASKLAKCFPNLKSLEIRGCIVPNKVLGIILNGHNNLELLDLQPYFYRFAEARVQSNLRPQKQVLIS